MPEPCYAVVALAALPADAPSSVRPSVLAILAWVAREEGDQSQAVKQQREAFALLGETQDAPALTVALETVARIAVDGGHPEAAARLLGTADALRVRSCVAIPPFNLNEHQAVLARTRELLSEA